jgi:hypothetical protein
MGAIENFLKKKINDQYIRIFESRSVPKSEIAGLIG